MAEQAFYVHGLVGVTEDTNDEYVVLTSSVALNRANIEMTFDNPEITPEIERAIEFEPDLTLYKMVPVGLLSEAYANKEVSK